jgi:hypothetical protein
LVVTDAVLVVQPSRAAAQRSAEVAAVDPESPELLDGGGGSGL